MSFSEAIRSVFSQYAGFNGRARRSEYWCFCLFVMIVEFVLRFLLSASGGVIFAVLLLIFALATLLPSLAVSVRRLHDTGRSGWWLLIGLVPVIGEIVLFVFMILDSDSANQYGLNPKR